jgi:hypothetical protein
MGKGADFTCTRLSGCVLDVSEPEDADPEFTARAIGIWAHRWLAKIGGISRGDGFRPLPSAGDLENIVRGSAVADRESTEKLLARCGRTVPDWWRAIWEDALATAVALGRKDPNWLRMDTLRYRVSPRRNVRCVGRRRGASP